MEAITRLSKKRFLAALALALGGVVYLLADRYLIEHEQIENAGAWSATQVQRAEYEEVSELPPPGRVPSANQEVENSAAEPVFDDWSYQSDAASISIQTVVRGSGQDTQTYYVADVILSEGANLLSAFAKDSFGLNIVEKTSQIAENHDAIFAVNGDYYGFREDGIVIRNGVIFRDEPARVGLAMFRDGAMEIYDETATSAQELLDAGVWNTLSFGPALVQDGQVYSSAGRVQVDSNFGNHSIQGNNPRTGIGVIAPNHYVFIVVDGRSAGYSRGASLEEFAQMFNDLGCTQAYNMDGGGSATMYFNGRVVNNPLGRNRERGTSDILYVEF
jgi:exopolysaccharide biosynthesis protein